MMDPNNFLARYFMSILTNLFLFFSLIVNLFTGSADTEKTSANVRESLPIVQAVTDSLSPAASLPERPEDAYGTHYDNMPYEHYDPDAFYDQVDILYDLADGRDPDALCRQYDLLYREYAYIDSLYVLADLQSSTDLYDSYWADELLYNIDLWSDAGGALCDACSYALAGPLGEDFARYLGPEAANALSEYEGMGVRESNLYMLEAQLEAEYTQLAATAWEDAVFTYKGHEWTWEELNSYRGDTLYEKDFDGYWEVYYGLDKAANDVLGPIFLELVSVRAETAELLGYESYSEYAYETFYARDYSPEDAQRLCDAVKPLAEEYYADLYYSDLWYAHGEVQPALDSESLLLALGNSIEALAPELSAPYEYMLENHLYILSDSPSSLPGAYTTELSYYRSPFLYCGLYGDCYDLSTLTHEFGHFCDTFYTPLPNLLVSAGSYDLFEIHSTGLELLFTEYYDSVYSEGADIARFMTLGAQLESIIDGCIMDEFQRRVYADPDITLEELNRLYARILSDYGYPAEREEYGWVYTSHNFDNPLYYISYATAALASLQLWDMAQEDMDTAVDTYLSILGQSAYDAGYMEVLESTGLRLFTEENAVEDICRPALEELERLD